MAKVKLIWTRLALQDLDSAYEYIAKESPEAAKSVIQRVERLLDSLQRYPKLGRLGRLSGTRELVMPTLPFVIAYRIKRGEIQILAFLHAARSWPEEL